MDYKLEDIINIPLLQELQDKLNVIYSFPSAIIDNDGKILVAVAWQDICAKFHRHHPESEKECIKSDKYILENLHKAKPAVTYRCPHGLIDCAAPIIINGKHLGSFFTGQFFLEKPDLDFFKKIAKKYGFDEKDYLKAVEKVPIWTKEKLDHYLDFIKGFIEIIAGIGLKNIKEIEVKEELEKANNELTTSRTTALKMMEEAVNANNALEITNKKLNEEIEERKRKEEELNKQMYFFEQMFMQSSVSTQILDRDGWCERINPKLSEIFGVKPQNIEGKIYNIFMDEGIKQGGVIPHLEKVFYEGKTAEWEVFFDIGVAANSQNIKVKEKKKVWYSNWAYPIFDKEGRISHVIIQHNDITKRKQTEEFLAESDKFNKQVVQSAQEGIIVYDLDMKYQVWNSFMEKLSGVPASEVLGRRPLELFPFLKDAGIIEIVKRALTGEIVRDVNVPFYVPLSEKFGCASDTTAPLYNTAGEIVGAITTVQDITARKHAEEELHKNHEMLIKLSDQVPGVVYQYRLYPDGRSCFPFSSVGMNDIYEVTPEEVREDATPVFGRLHPDDHDLVANLIFESARTLELFHCEFRVILPRQGLRWRISNARPERMPDGGTLWYGIISDFTDRKLVEMELQKYRNHLEELVKLRTEEWNDANEELKIQLEKQKELEMILQQSLEKEKELSEMKSRFISTISHEFRTPLTSVLTSTELIQRYGESWNDDKKKNHLERIKHSVEYLTRLLDDVLTISKTETGKMGFNPELIDLQKITDECIQNAKSQITDLHDLKVNFNLQQTDFFLDAKLMKFIFNNLLSNAAKYSPEGGKIEFTISNNEDYLTIEVKDEGIGIPTEESEKIFESFYRTKNADSIAGTGLGLTIVKRAVDLHKGNISVCSELGKGSKFVIKIPVRIEY